MADQQLLLLEDVEDLGRKGDVVKVKAGYARNYLLPKQFGVHASKNALRMRERLQEERRRQAAEDRKAAEEQAKKLEGTVLSIEVKVDPEGHMYGSVSVSDICHLIGEEKKIEVDKKSVLLPHPIKTTGIHEILLRLKEGVETTVTLKVIPEGGELPIQEEDVQEEPAAEPVDLEAPAAEEE